MTLLFDGIRYNKFDQFIESLVGFSSVDELTANDIMKMDSPELIPSAYAHFESIFLMSVSMEYVGYFGMKLQDLCLEICLHLTEAMEMSCLQKKRTLEMTKAE